MRWPQQVVDIGEGGLAERAQYLTLDHEHVLAHDLFDFDTAHIEFPVGCLVRPERKQRRVFVGRDDVGGGVHGKLRRMAGSPAVIAPLRANGKPSGLVLDAPRLAYLP